MKTTKIGANGLMVFLTEQDDLFMVGGSHGDISIQKAREVCEYLENNFPMAMESYDISEDIGGWWIVKHRDYPPVLVSKDTRVGYLMWGPTDWLTNIQVGEFAGMIRQALEISEDMGE